MTTAEQRVLQAARLYLAAQGTTRLTVLRARRQLLDAVRSLREEERARKGVAEP